jgi:hypothetical protein
MSNDYMPINDRKFLTWVKNLFGYLTAHATEWNVNPNSWTNIYPTMVTNYEKALDKAEAPNRGKADVELKNETRDTLKKGMRQYVKEFLEYNSRVTNKDRDYMGLPIHDSKPTPVEDPTTLPVAEVILPSPGVIELHVTDSKSGKKAKPAGVHGFEAVYVVLDVRPVDWSELLHSRFSTRTPLRLTFSGHERGKTIYFATRWENTRGVKGPWSEIMDAIIP